MFYSLDFSFQREFYRADIVTWLILPVVICLSQRLSHACLSISTCTVKLRMAHYISYRLFDCTFYYMDTCGNSRANTCVKIRTSGRDVFIRLKTNASSCSLLWWFMIAFRITWLSAGDVSFKFLPYQLLMVRWWLTMVVTGDGELGFDSGEGA